MRAVVATPPLIAEAPVVAKQAGLRYVSDSRPGITRRARRDGFDYFAPDGTRIDDVDEIARIRAIAIPPAWTDVWICPAPNGHIQATGRDARKRKQYRYHVRWRQVRDEAKYDRLIGFAQMLPKIRERVDQALRLPGLPREKVLAAIVHLLQTTMMRIGNEEYARSNKSFGLTTLRNRHAQVNGDQLVLNFRGKSGVQHRITLRDRRLARIVRRLRDLPGQELFEYIDDDGELRAVDSSDVNEYLHEMCGESYTAKDFRTWSGTLLAATTLCELECPDSAAQAKRIVTEAIESVAQRLGNTPAICRKCYIHPAVLDAWLDGTLHELMQVPPSASAQAGCLQSEEAGVLALLQARVESEARSGSSVRSALVASVSASGGAAQRRRRNAARAAAD